MTTYLSKTELVIVISLLLISSVLFPLKLYFFALVFLGFPHVIWEMSWIGKLYGKKINKNWWKLTGSILAIQIIARTGNWLSLLDSVIVQYIDLLTLALLIVIAAFVVVTTKKTLYSLLLALIVLLVGLALMYATAQKNLVFILVCLSIAHNFTPALLVQSAQQQEFKKLKILLPLLFGLPVLLLGILAFYISLFLAPKNPLFYPVMPTELSWLNEKSPALFAAALPSLVLAQCLHYYTVIRIIPASLGTELKIYPGAKAAIVASGLVMIFFLFNFTSAKSFYAIVAGTHAWLEWFLIAVMTGSLFSSDNLEQVNYR